MSTSQRAFRGMPDRLYPLPTLKVSGTSFARPPRPLWRSLANLPRTSSGPGNRARVLATREQIRAKCK